MATTTNFKGLRFDFKDEFGIEWNSKPEMFIAYCNARMLLAQAQELQAIREVLAPISKNFIVKNVNEKIG